MSSAGAVPQVLEEWIERWAERPLDVPVAELTEAGLRALRAALKLPPEDRGTAQALLAADASLTAAVERSADSDDPGKALSELLDRIVSMSPGTGEGV